MITFKKNGRPTKHEKGLLKNINNILSSVDDSDQQHYGFFNEKVTEGSRLEEIWNILNGEFTEGIELPKQEPKPVEVEEERYEDFDGGKVDTETGEVIEDEPTREVEVENKIEEKEEEAAEEANFVNEEKKKAMEDATILEEINGEEPKNQGVPEFFNPLSEPVKERSYNKNPTTSVGEIEEPDFGDAPTPREELQELEEERAEAQYDEEDEESAFSNVTNEHMNDLDPKDKKLAAKQLVETVLGGYEMLHELGKNFVKYPEDKLQEKAIKGEIDPTMEIPIDEHGNTTNPIDFFKEFNETAEEAIAYDPEFGEKVRPAMERVFAKRGWGLTDEQFLLVAFGKDIAFKGVQIMNLRKTANGIMDTFVQLQQEKIAAMGQAHPAQSVAPDAIVTPPRQEEPPQPVYQHPHEEEEYDEHEEEYEVENEE